MYSKSAGKISTENLASGSASLPALINL